MEHLSETDDRMPTGFGADEAAGHQTDRALRMLGIWAHPDDESYLSAGLMARTVAAGGLVTVVAITDGEAGFPADDPWPSDLRSLQRRGELKSAMASIGVSDIRFLGVPDGQVAIAAETPLISRLERIIAEVRPDVIVTFGPDGITGHEDHIANSRLATLAWLKSGMGELWYAAKSQAWLDEWRELHDTFGVWMTEEPTGIPADEIELIVDLSDAELKQKRSVLAAHASQTESLAALFGEDAYRRWVAQETFRQPTRQELDAIGSGTFTGRLVTS